MTEPINRFSLAYYRQIIADALAHGFLVEPVRDFYREVCPPEKRLILRHDLDLRPQTLKAMLDVERDLGVRSTVYVRLAGAEYNFLSYNTFRVLKEAERDGFEIGLHTNFYEFAMLNNEDPKKIFDAEWEALRSHFDVTGLACHRDFNYTYNCLPYVRDNWDYFKEKVEYEAYDKDFIDNSVYLNEGMNPHLCWRNHTPEELVKGDKSIYFLTHSHWWWKDHPFEGQQ